MKKCKIIGIVFALLFLIFGLFSIPVKASMSELALISANPAEDSSNSMRLSWQSSLAKCTLYYTLESDTTFKDATSKAISGVKNDVKYSGNDSYYKYDVTLTSLQGNTKYIYKIEAGNVTSDTYSFKTAGNRGNFNFALIGDIHANTGDNALKNAVDLIKIGENLTANDGGFDFVLSQGDLVKYGQRYSDWETWNNNYILEHYMFSTCPGNKEYYNTGHDITSYEWFMATFNNPDNGPETLPTCYYFIYDSVLIFSLDNINPNARSLTSSIQTWMDGVISKNEGNYQYIIVVHHYADFFSANENNNICDWGSYNETWYKFYDSHDVDFVISGDYHSYTRTNQLYNNAVSTDPSKGTVYVTVPMVAPDVYTTVIQNSSNPLIAKWTPGGSATHGASYFKVSNGGLTYYEYGGDGKVYDSVTVKPKHLSEVSLNAMMNTVSIIQSEDKNTNVLYFSKDYNDIVTSVSIRINGDAKAMFYPSKDNVNTYTLPTLKQGDKVSLNIKFANNKNKILECKYSLLPSYGSIYGFHGEIENNKVQFSWKANLENDVVSTFELYKGDTKLATLSKNETSCTLDDKSLLKETITFKALTSEGEVVYQNEYSYFRLGDYNQDSQIDKADIDALKQAFLDGNSEIKAHDVDEDSRFDIFDLTMINLKVNGSKDLKTLYKVTILDVDNNIVSVQYVEKGSDAKTITLEDFGNYAFVGFDKPLKEIYQDTVIKAVYKLK